MAKAFTFTRAHLQHTTKVLSRAKGKLRQFAARRRAAIAETSVFAILFSAVLALETAMAAMMFSLLEVEVLGHVVSGAAFGLLVPVVIGAAHVQKYRDRDWLTNAWMGRMASIGILLFVLGISSMVGFSAWQAAQDAQMLIGMDFNSGPTGMLGGQNLLDPDALSGTDAGGTEGGFGFLPQALLFLGLSFGMVISVYFASFCLGRVLHGWAAITAPSLAGKGAVTKIDEVLGHIKALHHVINADTAARQRLPKDLKQRFSREAAQLCQHVAQAKLAAAERKFHPMRAEGPLAHAARDDAADALPARFTKEEEFLTHMSAQIKATSAPHIMRVLGSDKDQGRK
ncbi:hypothetical protein [Tateyamaria sp.]|uniref:hypothetical protein n=1 Tax=Tateyamaria sp. TaxID=1929288 RepID=UPI00329BDB11